MQHLQEANLAWSLIDAAKGRLDARERNHVFVSVGAGDAFTAIRILIKLIADKHIPLPTRLVRSCSGWLEAYVLHEDYERLQFLIAGLAAAGTHVRPRPVVRSLSRSRNAAAQPISVTEHERDMSVRAG